MHFSISKAINLIQNKIEHWLEIITTMLPNALVATIVVVLFYFIARLIKKVVGSIIERTSGRGAIQNLFSTLSYLSVLLVGAVIALNVLDLHQTVSSLLAGAGIIGLALGFAFQDITANFLAGIFMAFQRPIKVGDIIETNGYLGEVEQIDLRVTVLKTFQGLHILLPNKTVFTSPLTNFTKTNERRIDLEIGVSYGDDLKKVQNVAINAVKGLGCILKEREVNAWFHSFGDSSVNLTMMFWIEYPGDGTFLKARSEAIVTIMNAFNKHNITIPFPIRTLDFGIKGGEKLSQMPISISELHEAQSN